MNAARFKRVDALFSGALERPEAERGAFLSLACAGDRELLQEVASLLTADRRSGDFLEQQADELFGLRSQEERPGGRLGLYHLVEQIGEGSTGRVYLASKLAGQESEWYAVKVLRYGLSATQACQRFLHERAILARLTHPHVARFFDGGTTPDGRPFLVMEHVSGLPLDEHCDRRSLPLDLRLSLFSRILSAVEHAHEHFLIHRDLKPSNLLVNELGEPKLLDFGIAKQLRPVPGAGTAVQTATGLQLMTPIYASPEQVRGEPVTVASDIYSLGVVLYELLTGCSPYRLPQWRLPQVIEAILHQEPEPPSRMALAFTADSTPEERAARRMTSPGEMSHRLAGELDRVLLRALHKDPGRRYGTVPELALDLAACRQQTASPA